MVGDVIALEILDLPIRMMMFFSSKRFLWWAL